MIKKLGYIITAVSLVFLLGVVGADEFQPGGDFRHFIVGVGLTALAAIFGMMLVQIGGSRERD